MSTQYLETYNGSEAGAPAKRRTNARDEYALLLAAKTGDSAAFEILCKQSANTVFHLARRIMRNNEDAEDVVQESFQQAFIHLDRFNGDSRFSTWLSRIDIEDQGLNPEQLYGQMERRRILSEAIDELTPGTRKAIELRELGERSTEETAQIMGISVTAVKARVFHGRRRLRERLKQFVTPAWTARRNASRPGGNTGHFSADQVACDG